MSDVALIKLSDEYNANECVCFKFMCTTISFFPAKRAILARPFFLIKKCRNVRQ